MPRAIAFERCSCGIKLRLADLGVMLGFKFKSYESSE
jgi:hypothetical protein